MIAIGVASIASGIAYTGGPWPLGYNGLGDVFVMIFFGFVAVCGTVYVQTRPRAVPRLVSASLPVGALATAVLVVNNVRDREQDARSGKRTLAVRLGRRGALVEYVGLLVLAYAVPIALALSSGRGLLLLPIASAPIAAARVRALAGAVSGPEYNACLAASGALLMMFGVLFAVALWL